MCHRSRWVVASGLRWRWIEGRAGDGDGNLDPNGPADAYGHTTRNIDFDRPVLADIFRNRYADGPSQPDPDTDPNCTGNGYFLAFR